VRIFLYFIGKPRDTHANAMAEEFVKRSRRWARVEMREIRPRSFDPWEKHPSATRVLLDPAGRALDAAQFTALVERAGREARELVFVVGAADGAPEAWKPRADLLLSLSRLTFPHELARVLVAEQIYRALAGIHGHPYPR